MENKNTFQKTNGNKMRVEELYYVAQVSGAYEATSKAPDSPLSPSFTRIM
jgi:hypothetical protein